MFYVVLSFILVGNMFCQHVGESKCKVLVNSMFKRTQILFEVCLRAHISAASVPSTVHYTAARDISKVKTTETLCLMEPRNHTLPTNTNKQQAVTLRFKTLESIFI